ncbi:alpha/beta hydrolase [Sporomusa termitida]|uniref:Serine aminopeptidase, S33 n=1 Tax=Sporomusa termitida TaxID=2377 RepID=A0A517E0R3_9FIRM|nr:acetylxylan esterase [Sporomusa termitida]QDR83191.1 Serine aminopeptidase, S33 [Sporomusa termitida]
MEPIVIPNGNSRLSGILHPAGRPSETTLIISHGFRGTKEGGGRAVRLAETLATAGLHVIRYDFTPLQSLTCQISELAAVIEYARQAVSKKTILLGRSMGGSASLAAAAADRRIAGLILWSAPWDLTATFQLALGAHYNDLLTEKTLSITDEYGHLLLTADFIHDFKNHDLLAAVKRLSRKPLLILHGTADTIVPVSQAYTIYKLAAGPKELQLYKNSDHHLSGHTTLAGAAIIAWLRKEALL